MIDVSGVAVNYHDDLGGIYGLKLLKNSATSNSVRKHKKMVFLF